MLATLTTETIAVRTIFEALQENLTDESFAETLESLSEVLKRFR